MTVGMPIFADFEPKKMATIANVPYPIDREAKPGLILPTHICIWGKYRYSIF